MNRYYINRLIWIYFWLVITEGIFRKWLVPGLSDAFLVARDPVVLLIYILALNEKLLKPTRIMIAWLVLCMLTVIQSLFFTDASLLVIAYGVKANFLHFPLIFVIPQVFAISDVVKIGRWVLILSIPMALLMVVQFLADTNDFWNYGPGGKGGSQLRGGEGRIRPPGFFSFITGAAQFLALTSAVVLFGFLRRGVYPIVLLVVSGLAVVLSTAVSSSRLALGSIGIVFMMLGVAYLYNKQLPKRLVKIFIPIGFIMLVATNLDIFSEGRIAFESRLADTGDLDATWAERANSWTGRVFGDFTSSWSASKAAPFFGHGIGMGTNVGARLVSGKMYFQLAEGEWARIVLESGFLLGYIYLFLRIAIIVEIYRRAAQAVRQGNLLPLLLFGSCFMLILTGQVGQATTMGFTGMGGGLVLAACHASRPRSRQQRRLKSAQPFPFRDR